MRSLLRDLERRYGAAFKLKGNDTIAYDFPEGTPMPTVNAALAQMKAQKAGCVAVLRHVPWAALP